MRRGIVALLVVASWCLAAPISHAEQEALTPTAAGWWRVGPLALVTSAGLDENELLVEGLGADDNARQAVAALSFTLDGASPPSAAQLIVPVVSTTIPGASVLLCAVTAHFDTVSNGAPEDVPDHDCESSITAAVDDDGNLVADDVAGLARGSDLRVLLVTAEPGRIVLDAAEAELIIERPAAPPRDVDTPDPAEEPFDAPSSSGSDASTATSGFDPPGSPLAPAPAVGEADAPGAPEPETPEPSAVAATTTGYRPPASDFTARAMTALVIALALGAFTALNRGAMSRLRPAVVPWERPSPSPGAPPA